MEAPKSAYAETRGFRPSISCRPRSILGFITPSIPKKAPIRAFDADEMQTCLGFLPSRTPF
jgi:hypothetical protein